MSEVKIGQLFEVRGDLTIEWKIKMFSSLSSEKNARYESPNFYFSSASWCLWFYPNGCGEESDGHISIYLMRRSSGSPISVNYTFGLRETDGNGSRDVKIIGSKSSFTKISGEGFAKFMSRSYLMHRKKTLLHSDELNISCSLKCCEPNAISDSIFHRHETVSHNLNEIYKGGMRTDFIIKVKGDSIFAHRMILEKRSSYFAAMLHHDMKENQTGEVTLKNIDKSTVDAVLSYLYSGDIEILENENVLDIYAAAEMYDLVEVKDMCVKFIEGNISSEWLCDIIQFTDLHKDDRIRFCAREYFKKHSSDVLDTDKWKTFLKEKPNLALQFLG